MTMLQRFLFRDLDGNTRAIEAACAEHAAQHYPLPRWHLIDPLPVQEPPSEPICPDPQPPKTKLIISGGQVRRVTA